MDDVSFLTVNYLTIYDTNILQEIDKNQVENFFKLLCEIILFLIVFFSFFFNKKEF